MSSVLDQLALTAPQVKVNGAPLDPQWSAALDSLRINRGLSMMSRATLRFNDFGYALASAGVFALGATVEVVADTTTVFSGVVTGSMIDQPGNDLPLLVVSVDDQACKLSLSHQVKTYENMTAADVIRAICSTNGLSASVTAPSGAPTHEYLLQQGSDLAFVETLTRRMNCVWWVEGKQLTVVEAKGDLTQNAAMAVSVADDLIEFSVRASALRPLDVTVNGWDPNQLQDIVGKSPASAATSTVSADFASAYLTSKPGTSLGTTKFPIGDTNPNDQGEATLLATSMQTMLHSEGVVLRGTVYVHPKLKLMDRIDINQAGPAKGSYILTEIEHVFSTRGFVTKFVAGPARQSVLADAFGPKAQDPGFVQHGLTTGVVSTVGSSSDSPDRTGMVKVKYSGGDGQLVSAWARVVSLGGGTSRGSVFLPEVQDEVLVGFERGDTRHPVVLGGLFGAKTPIAADSSAVANGKVAYRRITSRAGHVVEMKDGDSDPDKHIRLALGTAGHEIRLGADRADIKMPSGKPFAITVGDAKIEIDAQGNIAISGMKITLNATQDISIQSKTQIQAKGTAGISLQGATAELKGDATATLQSSGSTAVKGSVVMIN